MSNHKIIFTGPVGAGKTTAIHAISEIAPVSTDSKASDEVKRMKANTTVAMDYGYMDLGGGERLHIYGTPGQQRFDFMWKILTEGGIGLILLLDNSAEDPLADMRFFMSAFEAFIKKTGVAIGVTRMDTTASPRIHDYRAELKEMGAVVPVFDVDARERPDVETLVEALLFSIDPGAILAEPSGRAS